MTRGFADLHNHQFAYLGFGGNAFWGRAYGDITAALPWCTPVHGPGGTGDLLGNIARTVAYGTGILGPLGHNVGGYPQFDGWPRWDSITHQAVFEDWLFRAVQGGLRLMVMLAVNNEYMCGLTNNAPGRTCNDMEAVDLQLQAAKDMQAYIDEVNGGPGTGWYRIVYTPAEARAVIANGNLAVILGIEVDYLFNCRAEGDLTEDQLRQELDRYFDLGVRYLFPIHFGNNGFGGTAFQNALIRDAGGGPVSGRNPLGTVGAYTIETEDAQNLGYTYRTGRRNVQGLTDLGKTLIRELINRGMIVDIDHMSAYAKADTLDICEQLDCPVVSGHTGFVGLSLGDKRHEGQLTDLEVERIRHLGGMVNAIVRQGSLTEIGNAEATIALPHVCGNSSNTFAQAYLYAINRMGNKPTGFGTDFNGFAGLPGPRFGPEACPGGRGPGDQPGEVSYPFVAAATGTTMDRSVIGEKTFDINTDGLAHVGMLPDFIADLEAQGVTGELLNPLLRSASGFVTLWGKAWGVSRNRIGVLQTNGTLYVKEGALDAIWTEESANVQSFALAGDRIGVLQTNGTLYVKEGTLDAIWTEESANVQSFALAGDRIGVLQTNGTLYVKEGSLGAAWTEESTNVQSFALAGDRIGVLQTNGTLYVKEGSLGAAWTEESANVQSFTLTGDRIGVLQTNGTLYVKEGALDAIWTEESANVQSFALAGTRIGVLQTNGTLYVKEGALDAIWTEESANVQSFALAGTRIGVLQTNGTLYVKEGALDAIWTEESTNVQSFALVGTRIGVLQTNGTLYVKEGALDAIWTEESTNVQSFTLGISMSSPIQVI